MKPIKMQVRGMEKGDAWLPIEMGVAAPIRNQTRRMMSVEVERPTRTPCSMLIDVFFDWSIQVSRDGWR